MHETLFYICGGILAASAVSVSLLGLKNENFPGKWMPLIIAWFAIFAVGAGTFAVLHGKDESKDHDKEYAKATKEIEFNETKGPFVKAEEEQLEKEEAESGESSESGEENPESAEGAEEEAEEAPAEGGAEQEGAAGEEMEGEAGQEAEGAGAAGGNP